MAGMLYAPEGRVEHASHDHQTYTVLGIWRASLPGQRGLSRLAYTRASLEADYSETQPASQGHDYSEAPLGDNLWLLMCSSYGTRIMSMCLW